MSNFDTTTLHEVATILRDAARAEIMPRFRSLAAGAIRTKTGPLDLVTDADEAAERVITAALQARFPGCVVVGEEAASADPTILDGLAEAPLAFVVDPVDGTSNFAAGLPTFGCMAAAFRQGEVVAAWIHDPLGDDTAIAAAGQGAWIAGPDGVPRTRLRVADAAPVGRMLGIISYAYLEEPRRSHVAARMARLAGAWILRCAAHEYRLVAGGAAHVSLYNRLMPWDHAPGWLIHREAGGYAARFDGSPYDAARHRDGGLILAPDRDAWAAIHDALLGD
ncbi:inositol monophosphatase family protein [Roseomonas sp. CCTCC AB2023176]|uniref:inositol monophosphatase family protein n=1 Tax=Roseomonas sp. CCTCC AB2023176 TaxID=3342640 RepID=UPI0035E2014D